MLAYQKWILLIIYLRIKVEYFVTARIYSFHHKQQIEIANFIINNNNSVSILKIIIFIITFDSQKTFTNLNINYYLLIVLILIVYSTPNFK